MMPAAVHAPPLDLADWLVHGHTYFASGSSALADLRGLARWLHPIGVSIPELAGPALYALERLAPLSIPVFVDTGAFSEMTFEAVVPQVVAPITDETWERRLAVSTRIARALGPHAYCVAPDRVGDQDETLRRLALFAPVVRGWHACGARVVVPLQRGALSTLAFREAAVRALGLGAEDIVPALPGNKDATPLDEMERFLRAARPKALHLLGLGPRNARFHAVHALFERLAPGCALSYDSNLLAAYVGHTNGRGGGARVLTSLQVACLGGDAERAREDAVAFMVGPPMLLARAKLAGLLRRAAPPVQRGLFDAVEVE